MKSDQTDTPNPRSQSPTQGTTQPMGYDTDGKPLYSATVGRTSHVTVAPSSSNGHDFDPRLRAQYANEPRVVHATRSNDIPPFEISEPVQQKHEASKAKYPHLDLSSGEFVILDVKRHLIGLVAPLLGGALVLIALVVVLIVYPANPSAAGLPDFGLALMIGGLLMALTGIGTFIAVWVYLQNQFYLTNESVIQEIQTSLFSRREQMVSLGSIEDASFHQNGVLQTLLNYGSIRLSTEGDETTYRFYYVANPRPQITTINNAIESFKNGRPFDTTDDVN